MHVVFVEPRFPANQKNFIRALAECGVAVSAIGEGSKDSLDQELRRWLTHYEPIQNVTNEQQLFDAVRFIQKHARIDRLEATVEAHIMPAAHVREKAGIPGTTDELRDTKGSTRFAARSASTSSTGTFRRTARRRSPSKPATWRTRGSA